MEDSLDEAQNNLQWLVWSVCFNWFLPRSLFQECTCRLLKSPNDKVAELQTRPFEAFKRRFSGEILEVSISIGLLMHVRCIVESCWFVSINWSKYDRLIGTCFWRLSSSHHYPWQICVYTLSYDYTYTHDISLYLAIKNDELPMAIHGGLHVFPAFVQFSTGRDTGTVDALEPFESYKSLSDGNFLGVKS